MERDCAVLEQRLLTSSREHRISLHRLRKQVAFERLLARLWSGLRAVPGVTVYGPPPGRPRTPTVAFAVHGRSPHDVAKALADQAVFVSSGDFYAATVVERLGYARDGLVRAGCACYTTDEEVDRLVAGVVRLGDQ